MPDLYTYEQRGSHFFVRLHGRDERMVAHERTAQRIVRLLNGEPEEAAPAPKAEAPLPVSALLLTEKQVAALVAAGVQTVEQLRALSRDQLLDLPRVGVATADAVEAALSAAGV